MKSRKRYFILILLLLGWNRNILAAAIPFIDDQPTTHLHLNPNNGSLETVVRSFLEESRSAENYSKDGAQLYKIAEHEIKLIVKLLKSRGYYDGTVSYALREKSEQTKNGEITYNITVGPLYTISDISFSYPQEIAPPALKSLPIKPGGPLEAKLVLEARDSLLALAKNEYCLFETDIEYQVKLSQVKKSAEVLFTLRPSQKAHFNEVVFNGLTKLSPDYLYTQINVKKGDCFKRKAIDMAKLELLQTNLLASVDVSLQPMSDSKQISSMPVNLVFTVKERRQKTIKSGVGYSTDSGAGFVVNWEHRNLIGNAELLELEMGMNEISRIVAGNYTVPNFLIEKQTLLISAELKKEYTEAFESTQAESSAIIYRKFNKSITGSLGVAGTQSRVFENNSEEHFSLISLPASITYDNRSDLLNPKSGWTATSAVRPFFDISKSDTRFLQWALSGATYFGSDKIAMQPTLALRAASGSITGAALEDVPADQRFYVGGGNSVRGYAYQTIGEFVDDEPNGGKSFGELSLELRMKVVGNWGVVLFADGGYAYPTELPSFGNDFLWGAGIGVRYLLSFAPLRFDVAVPLDKREDVDDPYQIYISIGQAF